MQFMLKESMEPSAECHSDTERMEIKIETSENASDRESSIESFHTNKSEPSITTETELIDVDDIELSDEESWLYKSPKKTCDERSDNTQKWLDKNIDDMDDMELKATRSALLSKLNQLKLLNSSVEETKAKKDLKVASLSCDKQVEEKKTEGSKTSCNECCDNNASGVSVPENSCTSKVEKARLWSSDEDKEFKHEDQKLKSSEVVDVVDVQKIARLQEESLKLSMYKFLSRTGNKTPSGSRDLSPVSPAQVTVLNKPASVEALNTCSYKMNHSNIYSMAPLQGLKKQNMFNSSSALNCSQEFHRGSLPNINKGYYSLKSKKSKRPSEPKVSCPLPIYPTHSRVTVNGTMPQASSHSHHKTISPSYDHRESRTLPSSYRVHSRSNSSSRRDLSALSPSPRRESVPILGCNSSLEPNQRENYRKFSSPMPSTVVYPRYSSTSATVSPTKVFCAQPPSMHSPGLEYHRAASHSPSRRLPLSPVQHQSPRRGNSLASLRNGEVKTLPSKVPSKIPNPALRSGIPVPSYASRANDDDTWSQDCF